MPQSNSRQPLLPSKQATVLVGVISLRTLPILNSLPSRAPVLSFTNHSRGLSGFDFRTHGTGGRIFLYYNMRLAQLDGSRMTLDKYAQQRWHPIQGIVRVVAQQARSADAALRRARSGRFYVLSYAQRFSDLCRRRG